MYNPNKTYIAVYGTLRRGQSRNNVMDQYSDFIGMGTVKARMYSLTAYPAIFLDDTAEVLVELYEAKEDTLERFIRQLDAIEGHPFLYTRVVLPVNTEFGEYQAIVYVAGPHIEQTKDSLPEIQTGDWLNQL